MRPLVALLAICATLIAGYFAYEYVRQRPPLFLIKLVTATRPPPPLPAGEEAPLTVPEGFRATIFARETPGARVLTRDPRGVLVVSLTQSGKIVALPDTDGDGVSEKAVPILEKLNLPHGILFTCEESGTCSLFVAETDAVTRYDYDPTTMAAADPETLAELPSGGGHFTRTLLMHPDGNRLLVSVGSSCNVCIENNEQRASVLSIDLATRETKVFAEGLRNTVFMALHPVTGDVWGTDNGRDLIGDDIPPDEVNIIREGANYGWPICYGKNIHDTDFDPIRNPADSNGAGKNTCTGMEPSHIDLPAHSAALGLAFVPEEGWPEDMWHDLFIAYHGSWNRSTPTGYKVVRISLSSQGARTGTEIDFLTGFVEPGQGRNEATGRPVGLLAEPGGVLYVSDDRAGAVYRVTRTSLE